MQRDFKVIFISTRPMGIFIKFKEISKRHSNLIMDQDWYLQGGKGEIFPSIHLVFPLCGSKFCFPPREKKFPVSGSKPQPGKRGREVFIVDFYVNNNSTVNMCFFDMAKGFDKVSHPVLLLKPMKRRMPVALVKLLKFWFSISCIVFPGTILRSESYSLLAGIRQGGVLSSSSFLNICG